MSVLVEGSIKDNIFDQNPELEYIPEIIEIIEEHGKDLASKLLWGVYLMHDPDSKYFALGKEKRTDIVLEKYFKNSDFTKDQIASTADIYQSLVMSFNQRMYKLLMDRFEHSVLDDSDEETVALLKGLPSIYKGLEAAEQAFNRDKASNVRSKGKDQPNSAISRLK